MCMSRRCRTEVEQMSHKLVQASCACLHFSSLLAMNQTRARRAEFIYELKRHEYDVCTTSCELYRALLDTCTTLYEFCSTLSRHFLEFCRVEYLNPVFLGSMHKCFHFHSIAMIENKNKRGPGGLTCSRRTRA